MQRKLHQGKLINWKDDRGFGFIQDKNSREQIFIHISELKDSTRRPEPGDTIFFYTAIDKERGKTKAIQAFISGHRDRSPNTRKSSKSLFPIGIKNPTTFITKLSLVLALPAWTILQLPNLVTLLLLLTYLTSINIITFAAYWDDKTRAKRDKQRIPENTLHLLELAGGWIGGLIAQELIRHKSSKPSYQITFWAIVGLHQAFLLFSLSL